MFAKSSPPGFEPAAGPPEPLTPPWPQAGPARPRSDAWSGAGAIEPRYLALLDAVDEVVWSGSADQGTVFVAGGVERITGFPPAEVLALPGNLWIDRAHQDDRGKVDEAYRAAASGTPVAIEYRWQRKNGAWIWLRNSTRLGSTDGAATHDSILSEITDERRLQEQVRRLEVMEAISQRTGGIAHDFQNLLTVILSSGQLLSDALPESASTRQDVEAILDAANRASALTAQLLGFSRRSLPEPAVVHLDVVIEGLQNIFSRALGDDIALATRSAGDLRGVSMNRVQCEQVLMNLVLNARDAMPHGGTIEITTRNVSLAAERRTAQGIIGPGDYVRLRVSDAGCGMDADTIRRIFQPLFTTKARGKGTGLGLATCARIVGDVGGGIDVQSEPGRGSIFEVYVPAASAGVGAEPRAGAVPGRPRGTETILVIEDSDETRTLLRRVLESLGYRVIEAATGQEALAACDVHVDRIDLVLSDVAMTDIRGPESVGRIQARRPDARALFMSGHTRSTLLRDGTLPDSAHFIHKPFRHDALATKVREVLDAR